MRIVGNGLSTCEDKTDSGATCAEENEWMSTAGDSSFSAHVFIPTHLLGISEGLCFFTQRFDAWQFGFTGHHLLQDAPIY